MLQFEPNNSVFPEKNINKHKEAIFQHLKPHNPSMLHIQLYFKAPIMRHQSLMS